MRFGQPPKDSTLMMKQPEVGFSGFPPLRQKKTQGWGTEFFVSWGWICGGAHAVS